MSAEQLDLFTRPAAPDVSLRRGMRTLAVYLDAMRRIGHAERVKDLVAARAYVLAAVRAGHPKPITAAFDTLVWWREFLATVALPMLAEDAELPCESSRVWRAVYPAGVSLDVEVRTLVTSFGGGRFHARLPGACCGAHANTPRRAIEQLLGVADAYRIEAPVDTAVEMAEVCAVVEADFGARWRTTLAQWLPRESAP